MNGRVAAVRERAKELFQATRQDVRRARHLPGYVYFDPEIYELEIERIFMRDWLCVGRIEQFANPGDYKAMRVAGEPIIISRDKDNVLRAFSNVCRHRGVEVAPVGAGHATQFACPYHGWLYDLEGRLIGAPFSRENEGFDFKNCRLPPVKLETWVGFIFINFDPESQSLGRFLDDRGARAAEEFHPERTVIVDEYTFTLDCNWKFVPENFMDIYHAKAIHGTSFAKHFQMEGFGFQLAPDGRYHAHYTSNTMAPDGELLFGKMPWLADKPKDFAFTVFLRPNLNFFSRVDMVQPMVCYPLGPEKTQITAWTQLPIEWQNQPAFKEKCKVLGDFVRRVLAEDQEMVASLQNGVHSRAFVPGPTVPLEAAIHHTLNNYVDRLFGPDA